jgi:hypothetical protein
MAKPRTKTSRLQDGEQAEPSIPATTELQDVPLDEITLIFDTQARVAIDSHIINEYAEAMTEGATFPPVVLFRNAEGYWVGDGHHRCRAARQVGYPTIRAEVHEGGPREAFLHAAGANAQHGLRRTALDIRQTVRRFLMDEEWRQWSDREIARRCAVSHTIVGKMRAEMAERRVLLSGNGGQIPETRTVRRGEVTYTMDTSGIGTHQATPTPANGQPGTARHVRQTMQDVFGRGVQLPPPPVERPHAMEESLGDLYGRVLMYREAVERKGGLKVMTQDWTHDRREDFLRQVAEIHECWTTLAVEAQQAAPQAPLTLVPANSGVKSTTP